MIIIELKKSENSCLDIYVNGEYYHKVLNWESRLEAYLTAINNFNIDIDQSYTSVSNEFILNSGEWIRFDSFCQGRQPSLIAYYYFIEVVNKLSGKNKKIIIKDYHVNKWFISHMRELGFEIKISSMVWVLQYIFYQARWLKRLANLAIIIGNGFLKKRSKFKFCSKIVIVDVPRDKKNHRYGRYLKDLGQSYNLIYTSLENGFFYDDYGSRLYYANINISGLFAVIKESILLWDLKPKEMYENIYKKRLANVSILSIIKSKIIYKSHFNLMKSNQVDFLIFQSSFNNMSKKPIMMAAKNSLVKIINFIPRPISNLRPAEIVTKSEIKTKKLNPLADYHIVREKSSFELIKESSVESKYILFKNEYDSCGDEYFFQKKTITILLTGNNKDNKKLLLLISIVLKKMSENVDVLVKEHPLLRMDDESIKLVNSFKGKAEQHEEKFWYGMNSAVITISSTAAIEASIKGSGVVWCPFINDEALLIAKLMSKIGYISHSETDFEKFINYLIKGNAMMAFSEKCKNQSIEIYCRK